MSRKSDGEDCNEDIECKSDKCYKNTICVSEEGFRYLDSNDQLENATQNNVDDTKLAMLEGAVAREKRRTGKKDIDKLGGREGIKQKIENKKQEKREKNLSDVREAAAQKFKSQNKETVKSSPKQAPGGGGVVKSSPTQAPGGGGVKSSPKQARGGGGRVLEEYYVQNDDGSYEKIKVLGQPRGITQEYIDKKKKEIDELMKSDDYRDHKQGEALYNNLQALIKEAKTKITQPIMQSNFTPPVGTVKEIPKENSPFNIEKYKRLGIELATETDENIKKLKQDARRREEDKVSPIDDEKDKQATFNAMRKPDGTMRAPDDIDRNELLRLNIKQKKKDEGRGDKKKSAESDSVRPADKVKKEKLDDRSRGECLLCEGPVYPDNMNFCRTCNNIYHTECFQDILLNGDNRCPHCKSIFDREDIQLVEKMVRIKTCPPADRNNINPMFHELIETDDKPAKHVNPYTGTEELYSDIFKDNKEVNERKRVVPGSNPPITVTLQPVSNLALCNETQQVSIRGCEIYNFQIPYRVRLEDYVELINEFASGRLSYYILEDGTDFLLFAGDTDRIDNRIDPRLYANQDNSINNFTEFFDDLLQQRQQIQPIQQQLFPTPPGYNENFDDLTPPQPPRPQQPEQPLRTLADFDNYLNTFAPIQNPFREQTEPNPFDRRTQQPRQQPTNPVNRPPYTFYPPTQQPTNPFNNGRPSSNQRRSTRRSRGGRGGGGRIGGRGGGSSYEYTRGGKKKKTIKKNKKKTKKNKPIRKKTINKKNKKM